MGKRDSGGAESEEGQGQVSLPQALADVERDLIRDALQEASGNRSKAAKMLGITRRQLYRRLAALFTEAPLAALAKDAEDAAPAPINWASKPREMERWAKAEAAVKAMGIGTDTVVALPRQEVYFVPPSKRVAVARCPSRVWTLPWRGASAALVPALPIAPVHGRNAFAEDAGHDWQWKAGTLRYFSRIVDPAERPVWILCEFDPPKEKSK